MGLVLVSEAWRSVDGAFFNNDLAPVAILASHPRIRAAFSVAAQLEAIAPDV